MALVQKFYDFLDDEESVQAAIQAGAKEVSVSQKKNLNRLARALAFATPRKRRKRAASQRKRAASHSSPAPSSDSATQRATDTSPQSLSSFPTPSGSAQQIPRKDSPSELPSSPLLPPLNLMPPSGSSNSAAQITRGSSLQSLSSPPASSVSTPQTPRPSSSQSFSSPPASLRCNSMSPSRSSNSPTHMTRGSSSQSLSSPPESLGSPPQTPIDSIEAQFSPSPLVAPSISISQIRKGKGLTHMPPSPPPTSPRQAQLWSTLPKAPARVVPNSSAYGRSASPVPLLTPVSGTQSSCRINSTDLPPRAKRLKYSEPSTPTPNPMSGIPNSESMKSTYVPLSSTSTSIHSKRAAVEDENSETEAGIRPWKRVRRGETEVREVEISPRNVDESVTRKLSFGTSQWVQKSIKAVLELSADDLPRNFMAWQNFQAEPMLYLFGAESMPVEHQYISNSRDYEFYFLIYNLAVAVRQRSANDLFRSRILCVFFFDVYQLYFPDGQVTDSRLIKHMHIIKQTGIALESTNTAEAAAADVKYWIKLGKKFSVFTEQIGGVGSLFFLPTLTLSWFFHHYHASGQAHDIIMRHLRETVRLPDYLSLQGASANHLANGVRQNLILSFHDKQFGSTRTSD